jgi:hypothetical protein
LPAGWPKEFWRQGQQLTVLGSMQQHFLDRLRASIPLDDDGQANRMLDAMEDCMPLGALFEGRDEDDRGQHCGYSKLCPWCHARSVGRIYRRLIEGPCAAARLEGKKLVLARMSGRDATCGGGSVLQRSEVENIRRAGRESARSIAPESRTRGKLQEIGSCGCQDTQATAEADITSVPDRQAHHLMKPQTARRKTVDLRRIREKG